MGGKVAVGPTAEEGEVDLLGSGSKTARNGGCVVYFLFGEVVTGDEGLTDVGGDDADGVEIEIDTARHPSTFTLLHRFPVLEGVVNESLRGDCHDGVVEVAHLHRGEGYFLYRAIHACLLHRYPVALVQHVVAGETNTGNKSRDSVLENEHEYCRCRSKSGKQCERVAVDDYRHNHNHREEHHHNLEHSAEGVEILMMSRLGIGIEHFHRIDHLNGKTR